MPDAKLLLLAKNLRARAQEVLTQAEIMQDAAAQQIMRENCSELTSGRRSGRKTVGRMMPVSALANV